MIKFWSLLFNSLLFALTGSSARKLKSQDTNLLASRAFAQYMFPLTAQELVSP